MVDDRLSSPKCTEKNVPGILNKIRIETICDNYDTTLPEDCKNVG